MKPYEVERNLTKAARYIDEGRMPEADNLINYCESLGVSATMAYECLGETRLTLWRAWNSAGRPIKVQPVTTGDEYAALADDDLLSRAEEKQF